MTRKDRYDYIRIAKTLGYSAEIISRLEKATSIAEANRIMRTGREEL